MYKINKTLATHGMDSQQGLSIEEGWYVFDIRLMLRDEPTNSDNDYNICIDTVMYLLESTKVCIACGAGQSRSNAIAVAVLVKKYGMDFWDAMDLVRKEVPICQIEPCHIRALIRILDVKPPFSICDFRT